MGPWHAEPIFFAEALPERGAELHVVLPFEKDEFKKISVERGGPRWVSRFDRCLDNAKSVTYATEDGYMDDDILFVYANRLAMGLALQRGAHLDTNVSQVAVWDGQDAHGEGGATMEVAFWRSKGNPTDVIWPLPSGRRPPGTEKKGPKRIGPTNGKSRR